MTDDIRYEDPSAHAEVLEGRRAVEAFGRSRELVSGNGWSVFSVIMLTLVILIAVNVALSILLAPFADWLQGFVQSIVSGGLTAPFIALTWTLLYYRLRDARNEPAVAA